MCSKQLCKVRVEQGELYLLTTLWEDGAAGLHLALTDSDKAWTGSVSEELLGERARKMKMEFDDYVAETKKAVTRENVGNLNFEYSLKKDGSAFCFSWKKFVAKDKIRIQLGQAKLCLSDDSSEVVKEILEHSIVSAVKAQENMQALNTDNERLTAERSGLLKRLEKAVSSKADMEHDLYTKFVEVINNKKKRIRELKEEVDNNECLKPSTSDGVRPQVYKHDRQTDEESEDSKTPGSDCQTDEEMVEVQPSAKKNRVATHGLDDSLDLSLNMEQEEVPVTTATRRGRRTVVKKTPSKAVIPKVPSSEHKKTPGTRGRPSLAKKDSHSSNQSNLSRRSSDPDCEDLLADL